MTTYDIIERPERDRLGESPFWDEATQALYWVDIVGKRVHRFDPSTGEIARWPTPLHVSSVIPTERGDVIAPMTDGVYRLDLATGETTPFARPDIDAGNRSNETRTDSQGRLWLGTMCDNIGPKGEALEVKRMSGGVFCVTADGGSTRLLSGIGIPNAFCWTPDGRRFHCSDTIRGVIWSFAYDPDGPTLSDRQVFADEGPGNPDGAAMDEDGCLWSARWGGGRIIRFTPDGRVDREILLPVAQPSCCAFGGADRRTLYITSARQELQGLAPDSLDGSVFIVQAGVAGMPMHRFKG